MRAELICGANRLRAMSTLTKSRRAKNGKAPSGSFSIRAALHRILVLR